MIEAQLRSPVSERFDYASGICSGGCMDLDMLWERRGNFLAIENKWPDEDIPLGQLITLRALASLPNWTVWIVRGLPPSNIISVGLLDGDQRAVDADELRRGIQIWWDSRKATTP